jgi:hypothetical protein
LVCKPARPALLLAITDTTVITGITVTIDTAE